MPANINDIAAKLISERIDTILDAAKNTVSKVAVNLKGRLKNTYTSYITTIYNKYSTYKTLIYRDTPHHLKDFYEPLDLKNDNHKLISPDVKALAKLKHPILITGTGGCGKSTILKALLLDAIESQQWIPIFIELRDLDNSKTSLLEYISENMQLHKLKLPVDFIIDAIKCGGYALFLDGLDELSEINSERISEEIQQLAQMSPDNIYLVTSRPGKEFVAWKSFIELTVEPLTLKKACDLANRLEIDEQLKNRFVKDLKNELFKKHPTFFANPLLLCIMLLTYQDSASIPAELHNFYSLAFDALYFRHDALKEGFRRPTKTGLPVDKGRTIMAAFSLVTYLKQKTVFTETEVYDYLEKAVSLTGLTVNFRELLTDLMSAFCMLLKDGTRYTFTHRSFQEYFAAVYLVNAKEDQQKAICKQFINRIHHDQTLDLAHGMNPDLIETLIIIPFLQKVREKTKYKGRISKAGVFRYVSLLFVGVGPMGISDKGLRLKIGDVTYWYLHRFITRRFNLHSIGSANRKKEQARKRLVTYLKSSKTTDGCVKFSTLQKNPKIAKDTLDVLNFNEDLHNLMKLLDKLELRHEQQVASFKDLLKSR